MNSSRRLLHSEQQHTPALYQWMKLNNIKRTAHRHGLDLVLISLDLFFLFFFSFLFCWKKQQDLKLFYAFLMLFIHCIFRQLFFRGKMKCSIFLYEITWNLLSYLQGWMLKFSLWDCYMTSYAEEFSRCVHSVPYEM